MVAFFDGVDKELPPPPRVDMRAVAMDRAATATVDKLPSFTDQAGAGSGIDDDIDMGPTLSLARHTPRPATTHFMQLGTVTSQVCHMQIANAGGEGDASQLFVNATRSVLGKPPARAKMPCRSRPAAAPSRQSARQAKNPSTILVSQRATLPIVHGLGILGPKETMTAMAAKALIRRLDKPLSDSDIKAITKLTNLDAAALKIAAGMHGPDREALQATTSPC